MNNYSTEQLQKIVDDAPDGANAVTDTQVGIQYCIWSIDKITQKWDEIWGWHNAPEFYTWPFIKLSDIHAELESRPKFKVGDLVVYLSHIAPDIISIFEVAELTNAEKCYGISADDNCYLYYKDIRKATVAEEKAGHRIDEPEHIKVQCGRYTIEFKNLVEAKPQILPAIITAPFINPSLSDEPWQNTDAMSESHRSPACKCHEFPFDAELIPDAVNHPSHYTSDPSGIECIEITRHRNFNIGNAIKYLWRAGRKDQAATVQDLQKAIWYINDEIERLEGEQGE